MSSPTRLPGLNPANSANLAAVLGPTRWNRFVRNAASVSPAAIAAIGAKWGLSASTLAVTVSDFAKSRYVTVLAAASTSSTRMRPMRSRPMPSRAMSETTARSGGLSFLALFSALLSTSSRPASSPSLMPRAARRPAASASSTAGTASEFSAIMRRMVSTSTPNGCGRMTDGAAGIDRTIRGYLYRLPFGSSNVIVAYGVISDVWYT